MVAKISEFKGHKIITLSIGEDDKYPFSFGIAKAKLILDNLDEIKNFVKDSQ
ncbi:MAG: hypothetical protein QXZ44_06705 [Ferroplasma sp.]